jgi:hypothetical protein
MKTQRWAELHGGGARKERRDTALLNEGTHADCIMFTRDNVPFCAVCRRAIDAIVDLYSRSR